MVDYFTMRKMRAREESASALSCKLSQLLQDRYGIPDKTIWPREVDNPIVYVLVRTSKRPDKFRRCYESIRNQSEKNICVIVHTDDPRDTYVIGDIVIRGQTFPRASGNAVYNLYCNRLLDIVPLDDAYVHFIDDDDVYYDNYVIEKLKEKAHRKKINVCKTQRWNDVIFPRSWLSQLSYQTECVFMPAVIAKAARWWGNKSGDHYYTKQLTARYDTNWIDVIACRAQAGKGHGRPDTVGKAEGIVHGIVIRQFGDYQVGEVYAFDAEVAEKHEAGGRIIITYKGVEIAYETETGKQIEKISREQEE